ncbi:hypothetical protein M011DRAFT_469400 [Sporormia fimetaria CBS 119925]|uniref:Uncharacterized protein n=1 Tax=Sporormia fimetaria CBS 119925 TaxID=1340428 RepID=A0A6A6V998_9PLEO|nr:hypothetical protein M011DRAFT_469400 [Sporormia fimetaria CBS 119925]
MASEWNTCAFCLLGSACMLLPAMVVVVGTPLEPSLFLSNLDELRRTSHLGKVNHLTYALPRAEMIFRSLHCKVLSLA